MLYSAVGHGGASGYLAVLAATGLGQAQISVSSLILNILVSGLATLQFAGAGHFRAKLIWPFVLGSVPLAFLGGALKLTDKTYFALLALVLFWAGLRMLMGDPQQDEATHEPKVPLAVGTGAGIGLLSGMVGVGGGIFLSPITLLFKWATPKRTAALSAFFILVNSVAGLLGRLTKGLPELPPELGLWLVAGLVGGVIGSTVGARKFTGAGLRKLLGVVLVVAAVQTAIKHLG
jgi:uncharacterized membrane protein YfcA